MKVTVRVACGTVYQNQEFGGTWQNLLSDLKLGVFVLWASGLLERSCWRRNHLGMHVLSRRSSSERNLPSGDVEDGYSEQLNHQDLKTNTPTLSDVV